METDLSVLGEKRSALQIKGVRDGLLITLGEGEWDQVLEELLKKVEVQLDFFEGAKIALDVGERVLHAAEMGNLRDKLADRHVSLWAVIGNSPHTEQTAQVLGLATRLPTARPDRVIRSMDTHLAGETAVLVQRTLRSGYKISYEGHVVVIGDVNPGAEIVAAGSIVVWGKLRGVVHAGAQGDPLAVVCALDLMPTQLRIGDAIAVPPQRKDKPEPEIASLRDGQVIAETWKYK